MEIEETMVNDNEELTEEVVEEVAEPEESLETVTDEPKSSQGTSEPGWFKKRWDKEVGKLTSQIRDEISKEYEAQISPLKERLLEMDAQELVRSGAVKDLETAKELVRYRTGAPVQTKNAQGAKNTQDDPVVAAQVAMLRHQAERIAQSGGPDVRAAFMKNEDIKQKVISGEMDFYDVADYLKKAKKPPSPMRSPNGASGMSPNAIDSMSDEAFERMEKRIKEGARYSLK